jgi:hypothetical protein
MLWDEVWCGGTNVERVRLSELRKKEIAKKNFFFFSESTVVTPLP